jgi:hypothetical protein
MAHEKVKILDLLKGGISLAEVRWHEKKEKKKESRIYHPELNSAHPEYLLASTAFSSEPPTNRHQRSVVLKSIK